MNVRARRNLGFLLCVVLVLTAVAACAGSGEEAASGIMPGTTTVSVATTVSSATDDTSSTTTSGTSVTDTTDPDGFVDGLPGEWVGAYGQRPVVVLFYVPGQVDDEQVVKAMRELRSVYRTYTFLIYDYKLPAAYGDLPMTLEKEYGYRSAGYNSEPFTILIDREMNVRDIWSGYVDKGTLNQALINLGRS